MPRQLSGIQPSGKPHLGNYFGAIKQHIEALKDDYEDPKDRLFFVADLHALTTVNDKEALELGVWDIAATYFALGLDPSRCLYFRQSDVPEVTMLSWILSCCTGSGLLLRAHSYKDKVEKGLVANAGLLTYPVLMAADILIYGSDVVPVGKDQVQHVEMTQDMAGHFNARFNTDLLKKPTWQLSPTPKVPGVDGAKMSKSYGNEIWVFEEGEGLKKRLKAIVTDSRLPDEPKDPAELVVFQILKLFLKESDVQALEADIRQGGKSIGYGDLKKMIAAEMDEEFGEARERYRDFMPGGNQHGVLRDALHDGARHARGLARSLLWKVYDTVGLPNVAENLLSAW